MAIKVNYESAYNYNKGVITARTANSFTYERYYNFGAYDSGRVDITGLKAGHEYEITINVNQSYNDLNISLIGTTEDTDIGWFVGKDYGKIFTNTTTATIRATTTGTTLTLDVMQHGGKPAYAFTFSDIEVIDLTEPDLKTSIRFIDEKMQQIVECTRNIINHIGGVN